MVQICYLNWARSPHASSFKYSRLFAIGWLTILETIDETMVKDDALLDTLIQKLCELLNLSKEKVDKDLEIYRSNLEKITASAGSP